MADDPNFEQVKNSKLSGILGDISNTLGKAGNTLENAVRGELGSGMQSRASKIAELETSLIKIIRKSALVLIKKVTGGNDGSINRYGCVLAVLQYGYNADNFKFAENAQPACTVDQSIFDYVTISLAQMSYSVYDEKNNIVIINLLDELKKTPGWKQMKGDYENPVHKTLTGIFEASGAMTPENPVTGSKQNTPPLISRMLNSIHPEFTNNIERFANVIKSRAYLALPAMALGSLRRVVSRINGAIRAFGRMINSIYQGCIRIIQQFYSYINGIMQFIQQLLMSIIESIIPLDLICLILEAAQILLNDIGFFTSIFTQSGSIFNVLNQVQGFINTASSIASNPLGFLKGFLPPEVTNILDTIDQIGSDPDGFIGDMLNNYGMGYVADALRGDIVGALVNKFGPQYRAIPAISAFLNTSGLSVPPAYRPEPASAAWNYGSDEEPVADVDLNPLKNLNRIIKQTGKDFSKASKDLSKNISGIGPALTDINPSKWVDDSIDYVKANWKTTAELEAEEPSKRTQRTAANIGILTDAASQIGQAIDLSR